MNGERIENWGDVSFDSGELEVGIGNAKRNRVSPDNAINIACWIIALTGADLSLVSYHVNAIRQQEGM